MRRPILTSFDEDILNVHLENGCRYIVHERAFFFLYFKSTLDDTMKRVTKHERLRCISFRFPPSLT